MMKTYRWSPARARAGGMIATVLVGGGLLLTASNGIAAETSKQVEEQVRTALAPVVPALAPEAPPLPPPPLPVARVAAPAAPAKVQLAMLHPHPEPVAPLPAVPPVPPLPPVDADIDDDEISREIREALQEARRDIAEAQREAANERREALREAEHARREALRSAQESLRAGERAREQAVSARAQVRVAVRACGRTSHTVSMHIDDQGGKRIGRCTGWSEKEKAEFRRTMIASLERARASIASMDRSHMPGEARQSALESLDAQLERLRERK